AQEGEPEDVVRLARRRRRGRRRDRPARRGLRLLVALAAGVGAGERDEAGERALPVLVGALEGAGGAPEGALPEELHAAPEVVGRGGRTLSGRRLRTERQGGEREEQNRQDRRAEKYRTSWSQGSPPSGRGAGRVPAYFTGSGMPPG